VSKSLELDRALPNVVPGVTLAAMNTSQALRYARIAVILTSLAINHHVPGARLFDSEQSGSQEMKLQSQWQNDSAQTMGNKIQKAAQSFGFFAFFVVKFLLRPL
jgi:hypothetical protein